MTQRCKCEHFLRRVRERNAAPTPPAQQDDEALELLRALLDEQDGPPLLRRAKQWQAAVDAARALLIKRGTA